MIRNRTAPGNKSISCRPFQRRQGDKMIEEKSQLCTGSRRCRALGMMGLIVLAVDCILQLCLQETFTYARFQAISSLFLVKTPRFRDGAAAMDQTKTLADVVIPNIKSIDLSSPAFRPATNSTERQCSCFNTDTRSECCKRDVSYAHKFGYALTQFLFRPFRNDIKQGDIGPNQEAFAGCDRRHVMIVRNLYSALVSGYLYHRAGYECEMDQFGRRVQKFGGRRHHLWYLNFEPDPPRRNRTICDYIRQESEADGMRAYMLWCLGWWYKGIIPYYEHVKGLRQQDPQEPLRSIFVCFEDLTDPSQQEDLFYKIMDWFFPGGHNLKMPHEAMKEEYHGPHASNPDPEVRQRLRSLVQQLDRDDFNSTYTYMQSLFRCGQ